MNISDLVGYCLSKGAKSALLVAGQDIQIITAKGKLGASGIRLSEDQLDSLVLGPLDPVQTSELNEEGHIRFNVSVGSQIAEITAFVDQGKLSAVLSLSLGQVPEGFSNYGEIRPYMLSALRGSSSLFLAYPDGISELAANRLCLDCCSAEGLSPLVIGQDAGSVYNNELYGEVAVMVLPGSLGSLLDSGALSRLLSNNSLLLVKLDTILDIDLMKRLYLLAEQFAAKLVISFQSQDPDRLKNFTEYMRGNFYFRDAKGYFVECLSLEMDSQKGDAILMSQIGRSGDGSAKQLASLASEYKYSLEVVKDLAAKSKTVQYADVLNYL